MHWMAIFVILDGDAAKQQGEGAYPMDAFSVAYYALFKSLLYVSKSIYLQKHGPISGPLATVVKNILKVAKHLVSCHKYTVVGSSWTILELAVEGMQIVLFTPVTSICLSSLLREDTILILVRLTSI